MAVTIEQRRRRLNKRYWRRYGRRARQRARAARALARDAKCAALILIFLAYLWVTSE